MFRLSSLDSFFFFNDTATTEIYTLSLHDALPICPRDAVAALLRDGFHVAFADDGPPSAPITHRDRKSTRLNSSHSQISYAVFCLKKKKKKQKEEQPFKREPTTLTIPHERTTLNQP